MIKPVKRLLPKSLFGRTLLILITPLLVVQLVLGYIFFDRHTEKIVTTAASAVAGEVQSLWLLKKKGIPLDDLRVYATSMNLTLESLETSKSLELTKPALKSTTYEKSWVEFTLYEQLEQKLTSDFLFHFDDNSVGITLLENDQPYLKLSLSRKRLFSRTTPLVLIWTSISGVLLLGIASLFMKNQIKPIQKLAKAAQALGQGYLVEGFKPEGAYEVKKAGFAFLTMAERLKRHLNERLEVLAGISHDLRTPLTRLKLQMALIDHPAVEDMKKDVQEMQSMMESFLDFARGVQQEERTNLILQETLAKLLSYRTFQSVHVKCDPLLGFSLKKITFERCLDNLLSNAQKHATALYIEVFCINNELHLIIQDNGPGIPKQELDAVFKPFYQLDASRNKDSSGIGLGLSIVRDAVSAHGGTITLSSSNEHGGLQVHLLFPSCGATL